MADLIDRQAAIDALNGNITVTGKANAMAVQEYIRSVSLKIKDLPSAQQWIPVSPETMPESGKNVLLTCWNGEDVCDGWVDANGCWHIACEEVAEGYEPLAWQPLPEPWRGET